MQEGAFLRGEAPFCDKRALREKGTDHEKKIAIVLLALVICLTGCGGKAVLRLSVEGVGDYEMVQLPADLVNFSKTDEDGMTVTVKRDGDYRFVLRDESGQEHAFILRYQAGKAEAQAEDGLIVQVSVK